MENKQVRIPIFEHKIPWKSENKVKMAQKSINLRCQSASALGLNYGSGLVCGGSIAIDYPHRVAICENSLNLRFLIAHAPIGIEEERSRMSPHTLETHNLDLSFCPVVNPAPKKMTASQIARYNQKGCVRPFDIFSDEEIGDIRTYVDGLMDAMGDNGAFGINCYQARLAGIWDIATDNRILDLVEDILGRNFVCWASAILSKKPGDPRNVPWHQDASFWHLTPARTVTVWLAVDDVDEDNAAMLWIPGTHDKGAYAVQTTGAQSVFHFETMDAEKLGQPVADCLKAGQVSLHADMLVHGSRPNQSNRRRCGLTLRYCPSDVRITDENWARGVEAIVCRGEDVSGTWKHHARPANDDITKTSSPHVIGNN